MRSAGRSSPATGCAGICRGSSNGWATVLVAPVTTRVRGIPTEVELTAVDGLPRRCAANFDNVFTLRRERLRTPIARLSTTRLDEVCRAHRFAVGC
nr:type II toxin-antitoxin system PemK/MazF family toxin [Pseudonocardia sp.]